MKLLKFVKPVTEEVYVNQTDGGVKSLTPMFAILFVGTFSNESLPSMTVKAPAPAIGALIAFGAVWLRTESSVTLTYPS